MCLEDAGPQPEGDDKADDLLSDTPKLTFQFHIQMGRNSPKSFVD